MLTKLSLLTTFLVSIYSMTFGQKDFAFGKVSMEELKMKVYEKDSSAGAVILFDTGYLNGQELSFTRHIRVKILNKSGLEWGNWIFNTPTKGFFKVMVFNLVNNEIVKDKLDNSSIYKEEVVRGLQVYKVFAPNVKVGSVIDITYSFNGIPFEWRFQERIPVKYSELVLEESEFITYSKLFFGLEPIETASANKWKATNMPAFKVEPFTNNYGNYISKFVFQVTSFSIPQTRVYVALSTSWRNIINNLLDYSNFGGTLSSCNFLNSYAKQIKSQDLPIKQKIDSCYQYIQKNLKWNKVKTLFANENLRNAFLTTHTGNSADINLSLIALLNKAGINANPIVLSTRDHGLLLQHFPSEDRLNYVICYVQDNGVDMFLDATSEFCVPGILPARCLNGQGLLVKRDNEQWFTLNRKDDADIRKQFISIKINKDATATAKVTQDFIGHGFLDWAEEQNQNNSKEIRMNQLQENYPDLKILSYNVKKNDKASSAAAETIEVDLGNQLIDAGDELLFNPHILFDYTSNPFKSETRNCPVDMNYRKESNVTIIVQLPEGMKAKEIPESVNFHTPDNSASFTYMANRSGNSMQFKLILKITKHVFTEEEYLELRQFFTQVIKATNTQIQLIKS